MKRNASFRRTCSLENTFLFLQEVVQVIVPSGNAAALNARSWSVLEPSASRTRARGSVLWAPRTANPIRPGCPACGSKSFRDLLRVTHLALGGVQI